MTNPTHLTSEGPHAEQEDSQDSQDVVLTPAGVGDLDALAVSQLLGVVREQLERAWTSETSADPHGWGMPTAKLSYGQCAVTALVVQDLFGGQLLRCTADGVSHYFNELAAGTHVDLTRDQFPVFAQFSAPEPRERSYVLSHPDTERRYRLLRAALAERLP